MADVTVKRLEDFEAIFHGGFYRVRAGLGVSSFGLAVMEFPPNFGDYPEHDQAHDHQEEVYTALSGRATIRAGGEEHTLEPGVWVRVGPARSARSSPATSRRGCSRSAARPGAPYNPPEFTEEGAPDPLGEARAVGAASRAGGPASGTGPRRRRAGARPRRPARPRRSARRPRL